MHKSTVLPSLNAIAEIVSKILLLNYKLTNRQVSNAVVTLSEGQGHRTLKKIIIIDLQSDYLHSILLAGH